MSRLLRLLLSAALLLCGITLIVAELNVVVLPDWIRAVVALVFVSLTPGHGWSWALGLDKPLLEIALGLVLSLALSSLAAMITVATGVFDPAVLTAALLGVGLLGTCVWLLGPNFKQREIAL